MLANFLWTRFEAPLGLRGDGFCLRRRCISIWQVQKFNKVLNYCCKIIPALVVWYLWRARNLARLENLSLTKDEIFKLIWLDLKDMVSSLFPDLRTTLQNHSWESLVLYFENLHFCPRVKEVFWCFPNCSYKLNTDGSARGNPSLAAGGGILRDNSGSTIFVFSDFFGVKSSLQAETHALLLGMLLCEILNIQDIMVECDNLILINILNGLAATPWKLRLAFKQIDKIRHRVTRFQHCFREANRVADALANYGQSNRSIFFSQGSLDIPSNIKTLIFQDNIGLCNLRFH